MGHTIFVSKLLMRSFRMIIKVDGRLKEENIFDVLYYAASKE